MKYISFSQYNTYTGCPWHWKKIYIDGIRIDSPNIHFIFGTALHHVLQTYLTLFYVKSEKEANELDAPKLLLDTMIREFKKYEESVGNNDFVSANDLAEYYTDGVNIIDWFKKHRRDYFSKKGWKLVGCEVPLNYELLPGVQFIGYLDIVLENEIENKVKIIDFKKSYMGWKDKAKKDPMKRGQLQLYKYFYSKINNIKQSNIDVEFLILKQKIFDYGEFTAKRIQKFIPPQSEITLKKTFELFNNFVKTVFVNGDYNSDIIYEKLPSDSACKYCPFSNLPEHCDKNGK